MTSMSRRTLINSALGLGASTALLPTGSFASMQPIYDSNERASGWTTSVERGEVLPPHPAEVQPVTEYDANRPRRPLMAGERKLYIKVKRTGEVFNDVYGQGDLLYDDALSAIDHLMRDWRRDEVTKIDRNLIELLASIQEDTGYDEPLMIVSGYRSRQTNEALRRRRTGVAKNSYHIKGMAADITPTGASVATLRKIGLKLHAGGVGYYPRNGFIHLDTGPVRSWRG